MNFSDIVEKLEEFNTCSIGQGTADAKQLEQIILNCFRILDCDLVEARRIVSDCFDLEDQERTERLYRVEVVLYHPRTGQILERQLLTSLEPMTREEAFTFISKQPNLVGRLFMTV